MAHANRPYLRTWPGFFLADDKLCHICPMAPHVISTIQDTVRHEGCHEVTYFMIPAIGDYKEKPCCWVIEGLAAYFETVEVRDGKFLVGNPASTRIRTAREEMAAGKTMVTHRLERILPATCPRFAVGSTLPRGSPGRNFARAARESVERQRDSRWGRCSGPTAAGFTSRSPP